ncbi:MAG: AEC family transporter [Erysipelotrichales bacterium]|nr:AEC family transporter [Erysipelotrichales bacterium]
MLQDLLFSANIVLPIFLLIVIGYFLTKLKLWDEHFLKVANNVCFKCFLPVLLFSNVADANIFEVFDGKLILFACVSVALIAFTLFLIVPRFVKDPKRIGVMIQGTFRSNFLLFGIPLGQSIGGAEGTILAAVLAAFYVPVLNMLATIVLYVYSDAENKDLKSALIGIATNPLVIGGLSGLVFSVIRNMVGFEMPTILSTTLTNIKSIATPFAFLILGGDLKIDNLLKNIKYSIFAVVGRTVVIPVIMLTIASMFGFGKLQIGILLAIYATPNAVSSYAMARNYEADYELAGEIVTLSTIVSVVTMFIFITVCKNIGLI